MGQSIQMSALEDDLRVGLGEVVATLAPFSHTEAAMRIRALGEIASALGTDHLLELAAQVGCGGVELRAS